MFVASSFCSDFYPAKCLLAKLLISRAIDPYSPRHRIALAYQVAIRPATCRLRFLEEIILLHWRVCIDEQSYLRQLQKGSAKYASGRSPLPLFGTDPPNARAAATSKKGALSSPLFPRHPYRSPFLALCAPKHAAMNSTALPDAEGSVEVDPPENNPAATPEALTKDKKKKKHKKDKPYFPCKLASAVPISPDTKLFRFQVPADHAHLVRALPSPGTHSC